MVSGNIATGTGTSADELVIGTSGADTLVGGGGVDRFSAGAGNDTIVLQATDVANLANNTVANTKAFVDGGNGFDTLRVSASGVDLNLTTISNVGAMSGNSMSRINSIERIDLGADTTANALTLKGNDVNDMAGMNLIHTGVSADGNTWAAGTYALGASVVMHQLVVDGTASDTVNLKTGTWASMGTVTQGANTYNVYQNASTNSQVFVQSGVTVNLNVAPVVLDLNGDGVFSYTHTLIDMNGNGQFNYSAWAAPQDGVLVWNKYADGLVHDASQYAFTQYGGDTDLQGLAAGFDSNHDGVLNAQDAKFGEFMVWQDANGDGVSQASEMHRLADVGISSLNLTSDGVTRSNGNGVTEAGRTSATLADGSHMGVADAAFTYQAGAVQGGQGAFQLTGNGMSLDLDKLKAAVGNVSELDLGQGHNSLSLNLSDVLTRPLTVKGVSGDALELFTQGESVTTSMTQINGQTYQAFDFNRDGQLDLLVQQAVLVHMH